MRRYHVPRSFIEDGVNTLVLFEEFGGNPSLVSFQTVAIGKACGNAYENNTLDLTCQGRPISSIRFASFGDPVGTCGSFGKGSCEGQKDAFSIVQNVGSCFILEFSCLLSCSLKRNFNKQLLCRRVLEGRLVRFRFPRTLLAQQVVVISPRGLLWRLFAYR